MANIPGFKKVYFGNVEIKKVYRGSNLLYNSLIIYKPTNIYPANNSINIPVQPELESSAFSSNDPTLALGGAEYIIRKDSDDSIVYNYQS